MRPRLLDSGFLILPGGVLKTLSHQHVKLKFAIQLVSMQSARLADSLLEAKKTLTCQL